MTSIDRAASLIALEAAISLCEQISAMTKTKRSKFIMSL